MIWKDRDPLFSERAWWPSCVSMGHDDQGAPATSVEDRGELWFQHHSALELGIPVEVESFTIEVDSRQRARVLPNTVPTAALILICELEFSISKVKSGAHWRFDPEATARTLLPMMLKTTILLCEPIHAKDSCGRSTRDWEHMR